MRKNIGIIVNALYESYQLKILSGAFTAGKKLNVNLLTFVGGSLNSDPESLQRNQIYNLISKESLHGLIIMGLVVGFNLPKDRIAEFYNNFSKELPVVSIGLNLENIPSIIIDNTLGFKELLIHIIEKHKYKKIAFVKGPSNNEEAQSRYETFMKIMEYYGIKIDDNFIFEGDFSEIAGINAIRTFLDERKLFPEVIIFSNDTMAISAINELKRRGIKVPQDIAITGFDDIEEANLVDPPLTTVYQPLYDLGFKSIETCYSLIAGEKVHNKIILPTKAVIRNSCGCKILVYEKSIEHLNRAKLNSFEDLKNLKEEFLKYIERNLELYDKRIGTFLEKLYLSFISDLERETQREFLENLEKFLKEEKKDLEIYHEFISLLRKFLYPYLNDTLIIKAENLWHQARIVISNILDRIQKLDRVKTQQQTIQITGIGVDFITTFKLEHLLDSITSRLLAIEIPSFYISLYEDKIPPFKKAKLILAVNDGKRLRETNINYLLREIIPQKYLPKRRFTMVVEPLFFQNHPLGFAIFEVGPEIGIIYENLRSQISSAIQGALIFEEREKFINELTTINKIGSTITSTIESGALWNLVIKEISKIFEYSAFYIILCKENHTKFEIVAKDIKENIKKGLSSTEVDFILNILERKKPRCKRSKDGRIKSFLGVPIILGEKVKGALILEHFEKDNLYNDHSINILSIISDFIAVSIENIHLFEEIEKLAIMDPLTGVLNRRGFEEIYQKEVSRAKRYNRPLSVMILDMDDFKLLNDTYGHLFGDQILKEIANLLKKACRKGDTIGRYGGDEFAIILPETNIENSNKVAERILRKIKNNPIITPNKKKISLNISIGIASYPEDTLEPDKLLALADKAMYEAKIYGGGQYSYFSSPSRFSLLKEIPKFDIFLGLINAIDHKDNYTFTHCQDVAKYAYKLGEKLNLSKEELEILDLAGRLHDIGKIGIPSEILKKPGPLSESEWNIIKEHSKLGYLILSQIPKIEKLLHAVLYHHERYDGKGYPQNLQGEDIPLFARILTLADAYSAMKSDRPYRKALTKRQIIKEIQKNAGKQFDPELAKIFINLIEKGEV
ncbi:MAG: diguanylate cyclase [Dictyoglomaceae bacterium]